MDDCIRRAWLVLGAKSIDLEDVSAGYVCTELDLGSPEVREVVTNRPDQNGIDDRTQFYGSRAVTADITIAAPDARIDEVASAFAPFMLVSARPELHYVLDRGTNPERVLVLRPADYDWKVKGAITRDVHLAWVASDPIAYSPTWNTTTSWAGSSGAAGRVYNLTFPRSYPVGTTPPSNGVIQPSGDVPVRPLLRIYGPIVQPRVTFRDPQNNAQHFAFRNTTTIDANHWIDVDPNARTAYWDGDKSRPAMREINWWYPTVWPLLQPGVRYTMTLFADSGGANQVTQCVATWRDGWLS